MARPSALLYERYLPPLQRWARGRLQRWTQAGADADDLFQDALLNSLYLNRLV